MTSEPEHLASPRHGLRRFCRRDARHGQLWEPRERATLPPVAQGAPPPYDADDDPWNQPPDPNLQGNPENTNAPGEPLQHPELHQPPQPPLLQNPAAMPMGGGVQQLPHPLPLNPPLAPGAQGPGGWGVWPEQLPFMAPDPHPMGGALPGSAFDAPAELQRLRYLQEQYEAQGRLLRAQQEALRYVATRFGQPDPGAGGQLQQGQPEHRELRGPQGEPTHPGHQPHRGHLPPSEAAQGPPSTHMQEPGGHAPTETRLHGGGGHPQGQSNHAPNNLTGVDIMAFRETLDKFRDLQLRLRENNHTGVNKTDAPNIHQMCRVRRARARREHSRCTSHPILIGEGLTPPGQDPVHPLQDHHRKAQGPHLRGTLGRLHTRCPPLPPRPPPCRNCRRRRSR